MSNGTDSTTRGDLQRGTFGTGPVFLTAISTILGAVMFLRFGYAVGHTGFIGAVGIILLGHLVTIPTAMALAEIATNQKVAGGGEYYIISRSFGILIGAAIGIALFLSQAISVAFYVIAFGEAFRPVFAWLESSYGIVVTDARVVSLPALVLLAVVVLWRGADLGLKLLWIVAATVFVSLVLFFLGGGDSGAESVRDALVRSVDDPNTTFFVVFAIVFPAFTGMTAGVGLSGDLRDPSRSIPVGTLAATLVGMVIYVALALKLALSAGLEELATDQFVMAKIALWPPIIPIGLAAATISSAIGSALVAPRTLQALAADRILPVKWLNRWLSKGRGEIGDPVNASLVVFGLALVFVLAGDVNIVAMVITMFFMVTYGAICTISFLEHFSADPSYRPVFRSRWFVSLLGATMCLWLMFRISAGYALLALIVMFGLYIFLSLANPERNGLAALLQGAIFQIGRRLQVFLQKSSQRGADERWRPSVVCISSATFERREAFDLLRWLSYRYGFGSYIHYIQGYLSRATALESRETLERLVRLADVSNSQVYVDTMVSPSYTTAVAQLAQLPGISGKENNTVLFEYPKSHPEEVEDIISNYQLLCATGLDICILASSDLNFGYKREIHVWLTAADFDNASLMILLAYIILGHPDWGKAQIKLFAIYPEASLEQERERLWALVREGRIPIARRNIRLMAQQETVSKKSIISESSRDADLLIVGFRGESLQHRGAELFSGYDSVGDVLFVNSTTQVEIDERVQESELVPEEEDMDGESPSDAESSSSEEDAPSERASDVPDGF